MTSLGQLDDEHHERIREIATDYAERKPVRIADVFSSDVILASLDEPKVILPSYNPREIATHVAFTPEVFAAICPGCTCNTNPDEILPFLETGALRPILIADYTDYAEPLIKHIIRYPHISRHEFGFYRYLDLSSSGGSCLCQHCVNERRKDIALVIDAHDFPEAHRELDRLLHNLYPFLSPDYELIDSFQKAVVDHDSELMSNLLSLSWAVRDYRTIQAYKCRSLLPSDLVPSLIHELKESQDFEVNDGIEPIARAMASELDLYLPEDGDYAKWLERTLPYRNELSSLVNSLIDNSDDSSFTQLSSRLGSLNEETRRLRTNKRFLFYRASVGFLRSNKTLVASGLLAGAMGLTGNLVGCGVTAATGVGAEIAKRKAKNVQWPSEATHLVDQIGHSVRPFLHRLLAKYAGTDVRAIQLWDLKEQLRAPETGGEP